ncbi:hypothetical protein CPB84DRAFT_929608 [Gymnopilus junonius]|uniref:Uncharacterized protein n=1 Tax=Gymnopilus junonius TaxID=109634 RepID=A0A9P5TTV5_GYMJU|nr:hypothetical protein CPB84DRAFT_929608 [Gymnopilus junonius]
MSHITPPVQLSSPTMPPSPFLVPSTPASQKHKPAQGNYSGKHGHRMIGAEFENKFKDRKRLDKHLAALTVRHLKLLGQATLVKYACAERALLQFLTWYHRSEEKVLVSISVDRNFPLIPLLKLFFGNVAQDGRSSLGMGLTGWTLRTTTDFVRSFLSMLRRHGVQPPTQAQKMSFLIALSFSPTQKLQRLSLARFHPQILSV